MTTASNLKHGDTIPHPLNTDLPPVHVSHVVLTGAKKMGTDIPMVAIYLVDGPKVIKNVQVPGDREF